MTRELLAFLTESICFEKEKERRKIQSPTAILCLFTLFESFSALLQTLSLFALLIEVLLAQPSLQTSLDNLPLLVGDAEPGRISTSSLDDHVFSAQC